MNNEPEQKQIEGKLKCKQCGAILEYKPGTINLNCVYCGVENAIEQSDEQIEEIDYESFVRNQYASEEKVEVVAVRCNACGANITLKPNVTADACPYCASNIVVKSGSTSTVLKPKSVLPFDVDIKRAGEAFRRWVSGLWFAPNDLKKYHSIDEKINGIYVPYWTYDSNTESQYSGERGDYYYETETYEAEENGKTVTKTRQVRRTAWSPAYGVVQNAFDDILVVASHSLPEKYTIKLEPWDLSKLVPYNDQYLSGFRSETYQVEITDGLVKAKQRMEPVIHAAIRDDIGGDEQRIHSVRTAYNDITFKHILLPIWISSFRYKQKIFRFLVNGQTGEVQGERPYSAWKIFFAVLAGIIAVVLAFIILGK